MNQNLTEIAFVMDRSGSMESMKREAIGGYNAFLNAQKQLPGEVRFTLVLFDNEYLKPVDHVPLSMVPDLNDMTYQPRGSTALLDAMGRTMDEIGKRLAATSEDQRPGKVIIACMTDGYENASHHYDNAKVASMIEHQRTKYNWEFQFLGATLESREMAKSWSLKEEDIDAFEATPEGQFMAYELMNVKMTAKRMSR